MVLSVVRELKIQGYNSPELGPLYELGPLPIIVRDGKEPPYISDQAYVILKPHEFSILIKYLEAATQQWEQLKNTHS